MNNRSTKNRTRIALVIILTMLIPIIPFAVIGELPGERWLTANDERDYLFALTGGLLLSLDVLLPIPSSVIIVMLGARLDLLLGWLTAWLGLTVGNLIGYGLGRMWPSKWAPEVSTTPALFTLALSRPVPVFAEAMAIAAGAARTPLRVVIPACTIGNGVYALALAANGSLVLTSEFTILGVIVMVALPTLGWWFWQRSPRAGEAQHEL